MCSVHSTLDCTQSVQSYVEMFRRSRITQEQKQRIVQAYENEEEDYLPVADTLGVNRSTARGIDGLHLTSWRPSLTTCTSLAASLAWKSFIDLLRNFFELQVNLNGGNYLKVCTVKKGGVSSSIF